MSKYKLTQKTDANGNTQDIQLDASSVDLSNYVDKTSTQTISGTKTFSNGISVTHDVKSDYVQVASAGHETTNSYEKIATLSSTGYIRYRTPSEIRSDVDAQATLVSGTNIKTINNNSLLGSGNISISADTSDCLKNNVNGTLVGNSSDTPLFLQSKSTGSFIGFKNSSGTTLGYLGVNSSNKPIFYDTADHQLAYTSNLPDMSQYQVKQTYIMSNNSSSPTAISGMVSETAWYILYPNTYSGCIMGYANDGTTIRLKCNSPLVFRCSSTTGNITFNGITNSGAVATSVYKLSSFHLYKITFSS